LIARCLPLCAYCSMGFFLELPEMFFAFAIPVLRPKRIRTVRCSNSAECTRWRHRLTSPESETDRTITL
jgi:hypothetical protein